MTTLIVGTGSVTVGLVLSLAFFGHLRNPNALNRAFAAQALLPRVLIKPVAIGVATLEGVLGGAIVFAGATEQTNILQLAQGTAGLTLAGYAIYSWRVVLSGSKVPCGCSSADIPMSIWVTVRATALAALAALAALLPIAQELDAPSSSEYAVMVFSGATLALLLWLLPVALDPLEGTSSP